MALGNPDWALVLSGADNGLTTAGVLALAVSGNPATLPCGTCRAVLPDVTIGVFSASGGNLRLPSR
ncbi:MAG: hypothetical protein R3F56_16665 [Planctomycetota bacterium]